MLGKIFNFTNLATAVALAYVAFIANKVKSKLILRVSDWADYFSTDTSKTATDRNNHAGRF